MKNHFLNLLLVLIICPSWVNAQEKIIWSTNTDYDHNCEIKFPGMPTNTFKNTPDGIKFTTYAQYGQSTYILKVTDLKTEPSDKTGRAKKRIHSMATKFKGKVSEEQDWLLGTKKGISARINIAEEGKPEMLMMIKVIVVGNIQYEVSAMMPLEIYDPKFDDHFMNSFRFLN